ncbi:autotransporter outer membrane beta-barrel domain-containing protein [Azospirillum brasilense]|uniref:autotransporter outer membrane beta-barrel domain-containing protein n=1 Tax=Azospirillum brasilense TaxID=192 RepID=UPI000E67A50E|nr:autotransporter outer membrane beta-barrel domain-containing protein [Azospirillum brasilense]NUB26720.1 autotransporter domain-containing protein [Azospirillum brasilense]NUB30421.1 autotransporter domain-containing protein [Azospirillum brasilense]RIW04270.1 autotransporter domain-containing protein [Azospirillum brasilense]
MPPSPSPLESIRQSLMSGGRLPAVVAAPIALGVSLAANAAPMDTLSTIQNQTFEPTAGNILITSTGGVVDSGTGNQYTDLPTGVWVKAPNGWTLTNQGTIKISLETNFYQADGIYGQNYGTVINSGLISVPNTYVGILFAGSANNRKSTVENTGTIIGNWSAIESAHAISLTNGSTSNGTALIKSVRSAQAFSQVDYPAINVYGLTTPSVITNYGTIIGNVDALSVSGVSTIVNHGTIAAGNGFSAIKTFASGAGSFINLKDGSVLVGGIQAGGQNQVLLLEGGGTLSGPVSGLTTLNVNGTEWTLGGVSTAAATNLQAGTLRVNGSLTTGLQLSSGTTLTGTGTVVGNVTSPSGTTVTPGGSGAPGTLTVTGNYTQQSDSTLAIRTTSSAASKLAVTGTATIGGDLTVTTTGSGYGDSTTYTIVTATGGVSGAFTAITGSDATLTPTATFDTAGKRIQLTLTKVTPQPEPEPNPNPEPEPEPNPNPDPGPTPNPDPTPTPPTGVIDTSRPSFTNSDGAVQGSSVTFDGGTLRPASPLTIGQSVTVTGQGGTIAPNGNTVTLAGAVGGSGALAASGPGTVVVSGQLANAGGLSVGDGAALTVARSGVVAGGTLALNNGGSATVGGVVAVPVTVAHGGAMTVVEGGGVGGTLAVNGGTLTVAAYGAVNGAVTVTSGGSATLAGAVMAPVTVGDGTVTVAATGITGAVDVGNGGSATVNGVVSGSLTTSAGSTFSGGGTVRGPATLAGTVSPGNSPGVLTFQSAVTLTGTSVLNAEIDGPTAGFGAGNHDQIRVQGASFTAAGTLAPVLRGISGDATNTYTATLGQSFTIVQADGGVSGGFAAVTQPTAGLEAGTRFDTLYDATTVRLVVTPTNYAVRGGSRNQRAAGTAVDALRPAAGARLEGVAAPLFNGLYGLPGSGIAGALDQLSGKLHADTLAADRTNRRLFGSAVEGRLSALRGGAASSSGVRLAGSGNGTSAVGETGEARGSGGVWGQPLAAYSRSGSDGNAAGTTERIGGFLLGADHSYENGVSGGVALGYLRNRVTSRDGLGKADVDSYQATLYGSWSLRGTADSPFVEGAIGYGYANYDASRGIAFGTLGQGASGSADGHDFSAEIAAGHRMAFAGSDSAWIEPRAGLRFDRITREAFRESGGGVALDVEAAGWTSLRSTVGVRAGTSVTVGGWRLLPNAALAWEHDFADATASTTNRLGGVAFTSDASKPGRDALVVGAGLGVALDDRLTATIGVQDAIRARENTVSATAGLKWKL